MHTKQPTITSKQQDILRLIYRYRFLNRIQIQALMRHKDKSLVSIWLKDLREKQYLEWIYSSDLSSRTKPAIYYLGLHGIRYLKATQRLPVTEIRKRYRDKERTPEFISKSILLANYCLNMLNPGSSTVTYCFTTSTDYAHPDNEYNFFNEDSKIKPQLIIQKKTQEQITNCLLEVFDTTMPQYRIRKQLKEYVTFLDEGIWIGERDDPEPIALFVFPSKHLLIYAKRRLRLYIKDKPNAADIKILVTTTEQLTTNDVTAAIWEIVN
jgi:hypothetical protein